MSLFAGWMYRALLWKERQRARRATPAARPGKAPSEAGLRAPHLATGRRGETLAYWYLRQAGYKIVARNRPSDQQAGELDLVAWDGPVLSFVEVKTRTSAEAGPPEAAVNGAKRTRIARTAKEYLRHLGGRRVTYRFDIVSVSWDAEVGYHVRLTKDAFKER
ncbi:MAG TPA: YraN family protein [Terriglobia bacterium]|nr:YraN family protein [Terriglobia bacterium]